MSADDPLQALEDWVAPLLAKLSPVERRALARKVGQDLRRNQAVRITSQKNPDGTAYAPRKASKARNQQGSIRRGMFSKLKTAKHMRLRADEQTATIEFVGRTSRIARVHQRGLRDSVKPGGPTYRYPTRELLGVAEADRERIRSCLIEHLADPNRDAAL